MRGLTRTKVKHRNVLALALAAVSAAVLLGGCGTQTENAAEAEDDSSVLVVGCDNYAPFSYVDVDGNMTGIDVDLAQEAFTRMGYRAEFRVINWEAKKELLHKGEIDCVWSSFTMDGRENDYNWAGPYMESHQVVAVLPDSKITKLSDLEDKVIAVQSTTKPEDIIRSHDGTLPPLRKVLSVQKRELIFVLLSKGYADAIAGHDTTIEEFMEETGLEFRILDEPLQTVGLGVAFDKDDDRGIAAQLNDTLKEMREDGTVRETIGKYLPDAERFMGDSDEK